jgi:hypothetical protein
MCRGSYIYSPFILLCAEIVMCIVIASLSYSRLLLSDECYLIWLSILIPAVANLLTMLGVSLSRDSWKMIMTSYLINCILRSPNLFELGMIIIPDIANINTTSYICTHDPGYEFVMISTLVSSALFFIIGLCILWSLFTTLTRTRIFSDLIRQSIESEYGVMMTEVEVQEM